MITCIINGSTAYPATNQSIKITYANQYVTDEGEYSYDINFPMSIIENRRVFQNVSRFDVSKFTKKYDDCKLYVENRLILSGVGTIIGISESEIKLQIVGGKSRIKFNDKFTKRYIDELDLGQANPPGEKKIYQKGELAKKELNASYIINMQTFTYGKSGEYTFVPIWDETNDYPANFYFPMKEDYMAALYRCAVQPNLWYILQKVLEEEGYKLVHNDYDAWPWKDIYIASAFKTLNLSKCLPHWSIYTFIEEVRKLFNASFVFDEARKTVSIYKSSEIISKDENHCKIIEEYSVDYDEDESLSITENANLEYNLGDSSNRNNYEVIPQKVISTFPVFHIPTGLDVDVWQQFLSDKEKRQSLLLQDGAYLIYVKGDDEKEKWTECGFWSPLIRNQESDSSITLNISPAAETVKEVALGIAVNYNGNPRENRCFLSVTNDKESNAAETFEDDEEGAYYSVQDAIDDTSVLENEEDEQECMNVFLKTRFTYNTRPISDPAEYYKYDWPDFCTDWHINSNYHIRREYLDNDSKFTFSLCNGGKASVNSLQCNRIIDSKNCYEIKFMYAGIPDPSRIYIFKNKRFLCEKIELDIKDDEIEPIYTGYFYMLS